MENRRLKLDSSFLISLLQNSTKHIEFMKRQQWTITYYSLLLYTAIFGIYRYAKPDLKDLERIIVFLLGILVCGASSHFIKLFRNSIAEHRLIIKRIYGQHKLECEKIGIDPNQSDHRDIGIFVTLRATIIVGLFALGWLIFRKTVLQGGFMEGIQNNLFGILKNTFLPIVIAIITYLLVDRLGEWKSRRNDCKLGIAILDSLLGEVVTGLDCMNKTYGQLQQPTPVLPTQLLPTETWSGMQTIPDGVLLRIISTSKDVVAEGFRPSKIRNVCKDYFTHICPNYNNRVAKLLTSGTGQQALLAELLGYLGGGPNQGKYIATTQQVKEMLERTMELLDQNSKRWIPK